VEAERIDQHVAMTEVRRLFEQRWTLTDLARRTGGPARYVRTDEGGTIGFITPLSRNFCDGCNRVRVTCTGEIYLCLGQAARADLRAPLRASADDALLDAAIDEAIGRKPRGHDFVIRAGAAPAVERHMSVTGG
jgi:cyclic pyranopterin phosphate synthase